MFRVRVLWGRYELFRGGTRVQNLYARLTWLVRLVGLIRLIRLIRLVGSIRLIRLVRFVWVIGFVRQLLRRCLWGRRFLRLSGENRQNA